VSATTAPPRPAADAPALDRPRDAETPPEERLLGGRGPELAVAAGALLVALLAALVATDVTAIALDEGLLKQSAVHYTQNMPGNLFDDLNARGTSRLYSLVLSPLFLLFEGDTAVRAARGLNAVLFASAALPAYLLARQVIVSRRLQATAALAAITGPWLVLTTAVYTENLAYPLFLWTVWGVMRALRAPSPGRDAVALILIGALVCTRTQFGVLFAAYWLLAAGVPLLRARVRGDVAASLPAVVRLWLRGHPFSVALLAAAVLVVGYLAIRNRLHYQVQVVFGSYSEIQDRGSISSDMTVALLVEFVALSLGMGLVAAIVGIGWLARVLRRAEGPVWLFAVASVVLVGVLALATVYAQGGYLDERTEERYYFYGVPLVWIAAIAAVERRAPSWRALALIGGALALLLGVIANRVGLTPENGFLAPSLAATGRLTGDALNAIAVPGLSGRDLLFVACLAVVAGLVWAWRTGPRARVAAVVVVSLGAQVAMTWYVFGVVRGEVAGVPPRTGLFEGQAWVDHALPRGTRAAWLNSQGRANAGAAEAEQQIHLFWNDQIGRVANVPALGLPAVAPPLAGLAKDEWPAQEPPPGPLVQEAGSPHYQVNGRVLARSRDERYEVLMTDADAPVRWRAEGLLPDGYALPGEPVSISALAPEPGREVVVTLLVQAPERPASLRLRLGDGERRVAVPAGRRAFVRVATCPDGERVRGRLEGSGGTVLPDGSGRTVLVHTATVSAGARC
jgi:hypothetical protein